MMQNTSQQVDTKSLVYGKENWLLGVHIVLSLIIWIGVIVLSKGVVAIYLFLFFLLYVFAQSAFISSIKGNGVKLGQEQFPEIYSHYIQCSQLLGFSYPPDAYVVNSNGVINAFATRFFARDFVVLNSNTVDAFQTNPDSINFFIGHELGHIQRRHLLWRPFIWPSIFLPLIGSGYFRACEYTCDQFGRVCCKDVDTALKGVAALACGEKMWSAANLPVYADQARETGTFWKSFHELISDYPWLVKRFCRVENPTYSSPDRNPLAWLFAAFCFRAGGGALASLTSMMLIIILAGSYYAVKAFEQSMPMASGSIVGQLGDKKLDPQTATENDRTYRKFDGELDKLVPNAATGNDAEPVFFELGEIFTVNLQRENGDQYLQAGITVKVKDSESVGLIKQRLPKIRSKLIFLLSSKFPSELQTAAGKKKLVQELILEINKEIGKDGAIDVLFTSFMIQ